MVEKTFACFRAILYGWMGIAIVGAAGSFWASEPLPAFNPAGKSALSSAHSLSMERFQWNPFLPGIPSSQTVDKNEATPKEGKWTLRGTLRSATESRAVLEELSTGAQRWVREGEWIGSYQVVRIERESILLKDFLKEQRLTLRPDWEEVGLQKTVLAHTPDFERPEIQVEQVGLNEFVVKPQLLKKLSEHLPQMIQSLGFIFMELDKGKPAFLIDGEEAEMELFQGLGIEDGDAIISINGKPLNSEGELLAVFQSLSQEKEVRVELDRHEEVRVLTYYVQP